MSNNQQLQQASVRAFTGTAYSYNDDWMALFEANSITSGTFNDRMLVFINAHLATTYSNINDAKKAFAVAKGVTSWNELGTFDVANLYYAFSADLSLTDRIGAETLTHTRAGHAMMFDSTGKLTWAGNNLLLNTATLSTQNVTVTVNPMIISFKGTGTITLSGASTDGPLVGTGANDRVYLAFTPTAGTLTCTVSGSVTDARLSRVTYETTPRTVDDVNTTGAIYYAPRLVYDPATLTSLGLLIEAAATNFILQTEDFSSATWTKSNATISANAATDPTGGSGMDEITATAAGGYALQTIAGLTDSTTYVFSAVLSAAATSWVFLRFNDKAATAKGSWFDLSTGALGNPNGTLVARGIQDLGGGLYRCWIAGDAGVGASTPYVMIRPAASNGASSALNDSVYAWGVNGHAGSYPTSYVPATTASASRVADVVSTTDLSWFNALGGTFVIEGRATSEAALRKLFDLSDGTANERALAEISAAGVASLSVTDGGVAQAAISGVEVTAGEIDFKAAFRIEANNFAVCLNGETPVEDATGTMPTPTRFDILHAYTDLLQSNGTIASLKYYPPGISNSQLQLLTT